MTTIDVIAEYIDQKPAAAKSAMNDLYQLLLAIMPGAERRISYRMPTFFVDGQPVVYFDAHDGYTGFYPTSAPIKEFESELSQYRHSKGAVHLPWDQPLPEPLLTKMVQSRIASIKAGKAHPQRVTRAAEPMTDEVAQALAAAGLRGQYDARPWYQRNDYLRWIGAAKQPATRARRLAQMLSELRAGDVYMRMAWGPRK